MNDIASTLIACKKYFHVRRPFLILLLIAIVLAIYSPSIFGEICDVDDLNMFHTLENSKTMDLVSAFFPQTKSGAYYRPIIMISFYLDSKLLHLYEGFMKLENVFLHIINALLVYWMAIQLLSGDKRRTSSVPLVSALFFGLNPVTTESVNWISGRSDVLACTFILFSANCLLTFKHTQKFVFFFPSFFFMVLGFLTKETSIAFAVGAFLILDSQDLPKNTFLPQEPSRTLASRRWIFFALLLCAAVVFENLRQYAFTSSNDKLILTLKIICSDIPYSTFVVLNALSFYLKKIFFPFPLNFSIIEPEPLYDLLGLPILLFCFYLISRRTLVAGIFMTGILMITPAFLAAFKQIAWTAYAERYVYIASSFIIAASVHYGAIVLKEKTHFSIYGKFTVAVLLLVAAGGTLQRNIIWMHNITLYKDTVDKSSNNFLIQTGYGFCLVNAGDYQNARTQFTLANKMGASRKTFTSATPYIESMFGYVEDADVGLAYILEKEKKVSEAAEAYELILDKKRGRSLLALNRLISLYTYMLSQARTSSERAYPKKKLLLFTGNKYNFTDSHAVYWIGKILLVRGDREGAREFFRRAYDRFAADDEYRVIAGKWLKRLGNNHDILILKTSASSPVD